MISFEVKIIQEGARLHLICKTPGSHATPHEYELGMKFKQAVDDFRKKFISKLERDWEPESELLKFHRTAWHALESYANGNASPDLAREVLSKYSKKEAA